MKQEPKYVNFYKRTLEKSALHNLFFDQALYGHMESPLQPACLVTKMLDTGDEECTYHRLVLDGDFAQVKLEVVVAAAPLQEAFIDDALTSLPDFFENPEVDMQNKLEVARGLSHIRGVNTQDMILHNMTGRYVWVLVAVYPAGEAQVELRGMRLEFPKDPFTKYFPEIYQENDFFDRFVGIFQSMYLDLERRVDDLPRRLDYESADDAQVEELAGWLGIDNRDKLFSTSQLRHLIRNSDLFQGGKGTRRALEAVVELVVGVRPRIVEHFQWNSLPMDQERQSHYQRLYGQDCQQFCVILDVCRQNTPLPITLEELENLIQRYSVIGSRHKLVFLQNCSHTDSHAYLDVNCCLSTPEQASAEGLLLGGHITL